MINTTKNIWSSTKKKDDDTIALEKDLTAAVGMKVLIEHEGEAGKVVISYDDLEKHRKPLRFTFNKNALVDGIADGECFCCY